MAGSRNLRSRADYAMAQQQAGQELISLLGGIQLLGDVFYYDPSNDANGNAKGNDAFSGESEFAAKATLQGAIDATVSAHGDVIVCLRGTETVTETVTVNKSGISIIPEVMGLNPSAMGEFNALLADTSFTDGPVITVEAPCHIDGMGFVSRDTDATFFGGAAALIGGLSSAAPFGVVMSRCRFPKWGLDNRTGLAIEGSSDVLIDDCTFEGVGSDFGQGIYLQGAAANIEIRWCRFTDCDYALELGAFAGGGPHLDFHHNTVIGDDSKGINTQANTAKGIIRNNWFNTAVSTGTFDRTSAQLETQGLKLVGNKYANEAEGP